MCIFNTHMVALVQNEHLAFLNELVNSDSAL